MRGRPHRASVDVDGDKVRGRDFAVVQAEGIYQEERLRTRDAQGDVVEDRFSPSQVIEHPIAGGEPLSCAALGFGGRDEAISATRRLVHEQAFGLGGAGHVGNPRGPLDRAILIQLVRTIA